LFLNCVLSLAHMLQVFGSECFAHTNWVALSDDAANASFTLIGEDGFVTVSLSCVATEIVQHVSLISCQAWHSLFELLFGAPCACFSTAVLSDLTF